MEHRYERNIKCPYCEWEDNDSWEFDEDEGVVECGNCEKEFNVVREIKVTYSTSRIECEDDKHDYKLHSYFVSNKKHINGKYWEDLPESKWQYYRIEICELCDNKEYIEMTKAEYENALAKV